MGYEIKAVVGVKHEPDQWISSFIQMDLSKVGGGAIGTLDSDRKWVNDEAYFYGSDGDTRISMDLYDRHLRVIPLDIVLEAAIKDSEREDYRRFHIFREMLESVKKHYQPESRNGELVVAFFGY